MPLPVSLPAPLSARQPPASSFAPYVQDAPLKNADAWASLAHGNARPNGEVREGGPEGGSGQGGEDGEDEESDPLWEQFQSAEEDNAKKVGGSPPP